MSVDGTVLEAPKETHEKSQPGELPDGAIDKGDQGHGDHDQDVHDAGESRSKLVHYDTDEEAAEDFTDAK